MKQSKKFLVMLVATMLMATSVWAGDITIIKKLNGTVNENVGTVTSRVNEGLCTVTVTPANGYYIGQVTAEQTVDGSVAQGRLKVAPGMDNMLTVTASDSEADPSGETTWTFNMPTDENYNVEVVANFQQCTDLSGATVTLATTSFNYDGEAKEPAVQSVVLDSKTIDEANYTVSYSNNTNVGTATVSVTGKNTYMGTATATFTINKSAITPTVSLEGWTYGAAPQTISPIVTGNTGNGTVTYTYKAQGSEVFTNTVPENAGDHIIKATIAETANYQAGEATDTFTIAKAILSNVVIGDIADQTYTGSALTPTITVTFNDNTVDASEYNVNYTNNTNVGTATVTLTSKGVNFADGQENPSKTFQILAATATITASDQTETYNGEEQEFDNYSVTNGSVVVSYYGSEADRDAEENLLEVVMDAGTYYVKLEQANENYTSEPVNVTFTIEPKTLTDEMVLIEGGVFVYDGQPKTLEEEGMYGVDDSEIGYLMENEDFTVSYSNNTNVGTATVTFTGIGNYQGSVDREFYIVRQLDIHFSENNVWASYFAEEDLEIPEGLKAYIVTEIGETNVEVQEIQYIPQHVGVLLTYEEPAYAEGELFAYAYEGETQEIDNNLLKGCSSATAVSALNSDDKNIYILYNDNFVKTTSGTIPAFRCYLEVEYESGAQARLGITIDDSEINGISENIVVNSGKLANAIYDLNGRRMESSTLKKGLYIMNGKKIVVK